MRLFPVLVLGLVTLLLGIADAGRRSVRHAGGRIAYRCQR